MGFIRRLSNSTDLMLGMAERLGVDLDAAISQDPRQGALQVRSMALRCSGCANQSGCAELQGRCDHLDAAPDYCRNKDFMERAVNA
ncbi:DUF6455 family protein [Antarcticimicrobium luteum]|uniref:Adenylosuccinate lyase n=1 Tax=Antarcticimicrobium luteum TaxID=2547397 RepID=A0A4R5VFG2_9RHOB|nr:DUF6455 family protein [Antarcticimicrobium luteum]TDK51279.1 adenylosuccinate lyase [Antarcticimicrobium luteum]